MGICAVVIRGEVSDFFKSGYGYGSGDGYGYGSGYGSGYGYGNGYGSGDGYGYGSGDGDGDGDGYGSGEYWKAAVAAYASRWPQAQRARLAELKASGAIIAYWKSDVAGKACNGGRSKAVKIGDVQETSGPLALCAKGSLHATLLPPKWQGERTWIVALIGEVVKSDDKMASLKREIIGECI